MADQPLLSALCSICNNNPPKYRCPGCSARTCSLPCYKRHQQRAQCDGKRDPTKYVKKNKLHTAAGVDHDYNFIAGIERGLDKVDRLMEESSIGAVNRSTKLPGRNSNFEKRIQEAGVIIDRAPAGMSREKNNRTRISNKRGKHLIWTVEWIHEDERRQLGELSENVALSEAYKTLVTQPPHPSKKRKLGPEVDTAGSKQRSDQQDPDADSKETELKSEPIEESDPQHPGAPSETGAIPSIAGAIPTEDRLIGSHDLSRQSGKAYFYLVKPHTSSNRRVLVPLTADQQLSTCLQNRVVFEFPTIQILSTPPESLPPQFQLDSDYLEQERREQLELGELLALVKPLDGMPIDGDVKTETGTTSIAGLDDKKILEVLRRDLGTRF
ncbi:uncharacterized protein BDZ99DRAFT_556893 [Mytilinidion resinicola]|uniref:Box C/D snoRNA protein 1 n=1 Tax=Mytilinidion resinicola TaxID=574789 RepID=A0A6A6YZG5_9PEZI|nr:uncharacterized protein BDZ99DRAFT_556893 [Mytilinidion resinicola]KAF2813347.1 hypothetical protein BDZ99DRAFT_556893 [Mytilinidion resinicola]